MTVGQEDWPGTVAGNRAGRRSVLLRLVRGLGIAGLSLVLFAAAIGGYWVVLRYQGDNLHTVSEGILYRSAQLSPSETRSVAQHYGIKSVLNLRGAHPGQAWYDEEIGAARNLGLAHIDYALSAKRFVTSQQIDDILALMRQAPKPLLIHCKDGADRSALIAALYRYAEGGASAAEADGELSLLYGHFPYLFSRSGAMDDSFWSYVHSGQHSSAR